MYIIEIVRIEQNLFRAHQKLASSVVQTVTSGVSGGSSSGSSSPRSAEGSSRSNFWLGPLQAFSLQTSVGAESLCKFAREETLVRLEGLREDFTKEARDVRERLGKVQRAIGREQEGLLKAMREHERLWRQRCGNGAPSADAGEQRDVWLSELALHGQIETFLAEKSRFCSVLQELYNAVRLLHTSCSRRLSSAIAEHFTVKGKQQRAQVELLQDVVVRGVGAVEPEAEWHAALVRSRLDYEHGGLAAPPTDGFTASVLQQVALGAGVGDSTSSESVRMVRVVKAGLLMRPGSTFGPSWTPVFCLLTDSHFLHVYAAEAKKRPRRSVNSPRAESSPEAAAFHVPSPDDELSGRHLAELNTAISSAWLGFLSQQSGETPCNTLRIDARLLEPILTIALNESITVGVDERAQNERSWNVNVPGGTGFFSRSDRRHVFRSWTQDDMVDWCIALKDQIAASAMASSLKGGENVKQNAAQPTWTSHASPVENVLDPEHCTRGLPSPFEYDHPTPAAAAIPTVTVPSTSSTTPIFNLENPWD